MDTNGLPDRRVNVLLLDDSAPLRGMLAQLLEDLTFVRQIVQAEDVTSALRALDATAFAFAILDLNIPGDGSIHNGIDLTRAIKSRYPATKVALLTALGSAVDRAACIDAGADGFFDKGEFEDMLDWMSEYVERE